MTNSEMIKLLTRFHDELAKMTNNKKNATDYSQGYNFGLMMAYQKLKEILINGNK